MNLDKLLMEFVHESCERLDEKDFNGFLALCAPEFHYMVSAYSPEIDKDMVWMEQDREGLAKLFDTLPKHNSDHSPLSRHVIVSHIDYDQEKQQAQVKSRLQVFKTQLEGGVTELFGIGKIHDLIDVGENGTKLLDRTVRLDTRMLGLGSQIPL